MHLHHTNWDLRTLTLPFDSSTTEFGECSRYWKSRVIDRVVPPANLQQARKLVELVQQTPPELLPLFKPRFAAMFFEIDSLVDEINAGRIDVDAYASRIAAAHVDVEVQKELTFERVRSSEYSTAPSRSRCLFLIDGDGDDDVIAHMAAMGFDDPWRSVVEVEPLAGAELLRVDSLLLDCNTLAVAQQEQRARTYWAGTSAKSTAIEVLLSGRFRMTKVIRPAPAYANAPPK